MTKHAILVTLDSTRRPKSFKSSEIQFSTSSSPEIPRNPCIKRSWYRSAEFNGSCQRTLFPSSASCHPINPHRMMDFLEDNREASLIAAVTDSDPVLKKAATKSLPING